MINESTSNEDKGCLILLGLVALGFMAAAIIEVIKMMMIAGAVGMILYLIFQASKTEGFKQFVNSFFSFFSTKLDAAAEEDRKAREFFGGSAEEKKHCALIDGTRMYFDTEEEMDEAFRKSRVLCLEREGLKVVEEALETVDIRIEQAIKRERKNKLESLFLEEPEVEYSKSDGIKEENAVRQRQDKERELQYREQQLEIDTKLNTFQGQINSQNKFIYEFAHKVSEEILGLKIGFNERFDYLQKQHDSFANFVHSKVVEIDWYIKTEVGKVRSEMFQINKSLRDDITALDKKVDSNDYKLTMAIQDQAMLVRDYMNRVNTFSDKLQLQESRNQIILREAQGFYKDVKKEFDHNQRQIDVFLQKTDLAGSMLDYKIRGIQYTLNEFIDEKNFLLKDVASKKENYRLYQSNVQGRLLLTNLKHEQFMKEQTQAQRMIEMNMQNERERAKYENELNFAKQKVLDQQQRATNLQHEMAMQKYFKGFDF